jgi:hypothetical protein
MLRRIPLALVTVSVIFCATLPAPALAASPTCPQGTTATDYRTVKGVLAAKTCYKGSTDTVYWQDIAVDGVSAYAKVYYYAPGSSQTSIYVSPYDSDGANNGWHSARLAVDEKKSLLIYACAFDQKSSNGAINYGCGTGTPVAPADR